MKMRVKTYSTTDPGVTRRETDHRAVARRAAADGIVLLKNENGLLPLKKGAKVALYGSGANRTVKGGTGSGDVNERERVTVYQGLLNAGITVTTEKWIAGPGGLAGVPAGRRRQGHDELFPCLLLPSLYHARRTAH